MTIHRARRIAAIVILLVSLVLLIWGLWPYSPEIRNVPVLPADMQLPTPESYLPDLFWWI